MTDLKLFTNSALRTMSNTASIALLLATVVGWTHATSPVAHAQTYNVIYQFSGYDGTAPTAGVTIRAGNLWGTTSDGGSSGFGGTIYELVPMGGTWGRVPVVSSDDSPKARVIFGPDGRPYTTASGFGDYGYVANFRPSATICKTVNCSWIASRYVFTDSSSDGATPGYGDLTWDQQGNIYGTSTLGGGVNVGTVYEATPPVPPSKTWTEKVLWNFTGHDGEYPQNGVIFDSNGNLLGTAKQGGAYGYGTVFKLTPSGNTWTETNLYDFQGAADGQYPIAGLIMDSAGNFYGATSDGGSGGGGTVFELTPSGSTYTFTLLYSFSGQTGKNCGPWGTLTIDVAGSLYGTTYCGGTHMNGAVFKLTNTQNGWVYSSLHDFGSFRYDGALPISNVSFDANGNLFGTASNGGQAFRGVVWIITP